MELAQRELVIQQQAEQIEEMNASLAMMEECVTNMQVRVGQGVCVV